MRPMSIAVGQNTHGDGDKSETLVPAPGSAESPLGMPCHVRMNPPVDHVAAHADDVAGRWDL